MGLYDFTDLPQYLLNMLNEYEEEIYDIDAFFVDECQDIDETQFKIFDKVMARKKFYIGDDRQAIYAFNGALEDAFERYSADGYKFFELDVNYRSKQSIMDVADSFREFCDGGYITDVQTIKGSNITCDRGKGGCVYFIDKKGECTTTSNAPTEDPKQVIELLLSKPDTMILCRSNKQVRKLQALGITNCSTVHQAKGLEYQNVILTDILAETNEELNIAYVGMTRAKDELCVINFEYLIGLLPRINYTPAPKDTPNLLF
jgi:superfamily I DNA/RNA helicase